MEQINGVVIIDKDINMTSFDVVRKVKNILNCKKVGHTGTLDPMATGVLPICIGKATKAVNYLIKDEKEYIAEVKLGEITDTYDREGTIIDKKEILFTESELAEAINSFKGTILQKPPKYSALKINGKRMYDLARAGIDFEVKVREVNIFNIEIVNISMPMFTIKVKCSKGTYIRSLAYDIGEKLNCGAHLYNLRRINSGQFNINNAVKLDELNSISLKENLISIEDLFSDLNSISLNAYFKNLFVNGVCIKDLRLISILNEEGIFKVYDEEKNFLGIGKREKDFFKKESSF